MTVRQLKQKSKKVEQLQARLALISQQENAVARKVTNQQYRSLGEVVFELIALAETQQSYGELDLVALKKVVLGILDDKLKLNHERELFGLPLNLDNREKETKKLIIEGNVLLKWLEWGRVLQAEFKQGLDTYLQRNSDRTLFGLPLIENQPGGNLTPEASPEYDALDPSALSKQKSNQKLILMGRLLRYWVQTGKVTQAQYQEGIEGFLNAYRDNSDRALFDLAPLPYMMPNKKPAKKTESPVAVGSQTKNERKEVGLKTNLETASSTNIDSQQQVSTTPKTTGTSSTITKALKSTSVSKDKFSEW
ncbi:hypothetical protein HW132_07115 [Brasilonema sp. CT11]|nr:hypothetical protein [Brasilonema sp. CT11]